MAQAVQTAHGPENRLDSCRATREKRRIRNAAVHVDASQNLADGALQSRVRAHLDEGVDGHAFAMAAVQLLEAASRLWTGHGGQRIGEQDR